MKQLKKGSDGKYHDTARKTKRGRDLPAGVRGADEFDNYRATQDDWDGIRQALYDTQIYPAAGTTSLQFFNTARGSGTSYSGVGSKSFSDTNMQVGGQLPADQRFLVESLEIQFIPCLPAVAGFYPCDYHTAAAATWVNDQWLFRTSGNLSFNVAQKPYLNEAPLMVFPSKTNFEICGAVSDTTTAGTGQYNANLYANVKGRPYILHPYAVGLDWGEAFDITLAWPEGVVATQSTKPAVCRVRMDGILQRKTQ